MLLFLASQPTRACISMLVDSHCHIDQIDLEPFAGKLDNLIASCQAHGVGHMLCVAIDQEHHHEVLNIAASYDCIHASIGLHPVYNPGQLVDEKWLLDGALNQNVIAIGETGLDYYHCTGDVSWQQERFVQHIDVHRQTKLPLIIHSRNAKEDTINILHQHKAQSGVFHCFAEDWEMAKKALDLGFYLSFSGIVTFKNAAAIKEVATKAPLDRILVETDSPYLAPVPYRGKPNQPGYTRYVAEHIAELRGIDYEQVAAATTRNFCSLFAVEL